MNVFIETTGEDLFMAIYDHKYTLINFVYYPKLVQKVEKIPESFIFLLTAAKTNLQNVKNIYINLGPGTFTGSRISLVYARTLCQIAPITLHTTNTFSLIAPNSLEPQLINIDARGNKMFQATIQFGKLISQIEVVEKTLVQKIDYEKIKNDFSDFLHVFQKEKNLLDIHPIYAKDPQIGGASNV